MLLLSSGLFPVRSQPISGDALFVLFAVLNTNDCFTS
jgi:hypothetical protein